MTKEHMDRTVRGQFGFRMNFSSISAAWRRRTEFRSTDSSLSAANMRWIIWRKKKREMTKPAGVPLVFACKIIPFLYEIACRGEGQGQVQGQGQNQGLLAVQIFHIVQNPTNSLFQKTFSCYFWRSCGGQYPIAGAAKPASSARAGSVCRAQHRGGGMCDRGCWKLSGSAAQAISENSPSPSCRTYTPTPPFPLISSLEFADRKNDNRMEASADPVCRAQHLLRRAHHTRMTKQKNLSILHAMLPVSLSEGKCSRKLCLPQRVAFMCRAQHLLRRAHHTRMIERWSLLFLHATLPVSLPESTCSHISCLPSLLSIHNVPAARAFYSHYPIFMP